MKTCDLHCHSNRSDGSLTPTQLVRLAEEAGLSALALTDHNTTKGLAEFMDAGKESKTQTVAGCEFSTKYAGKELHIVGLFLPQESWKEVEDYVEFQHIAKNKSNLQLIENLCAAGYDISYEEVASITKADVFNRNHVARILLKKKYVESIDHAFATLLKAGNGYYIPAKKLSSAATIRFIKANGGKAVWAHPFFTMKQAEEVEEFLPQAKEAGLDAIETVYTTYSPEQTRHAKALAEKYGLLESGGSDYHGAGKPDISLGVGYGELQVPFSFFEKLRDK